MYVAPIQLCRNKNRPKIVVLSLLGDRNLDVNAYANMNAKVPMDVIEEYLDSLREIYTVAVSCAVDNI